MAPEMEADDSEAQWKEKVEYYCIKSTGEINHDWDFTIVCNTKLFIVTVSPGHPDDPTTSLLTQFSKAFAEDDDEKIQEAQDEIVELVFNAGWQKFRALAPHIPDGEISPQTSTKNLYSDLNPETFYFQLVMTERHTEIVQMDPPPQQLNPHHLDLKDSTLDLPRYSSRDITVTSKTMGLGYIAKFPYVERICAAKTPRHNPSKQCSANTTAC